MSMHRLLEESRRVKERADRLLSQSRILEILKPYGEPKIGGSYALDCMLRPDIDIFVTTKEHDYTKVMDIQRAIMETRFFREFDFVNWVDFDDPEVMDVKEYYFQPWVPFEGVLWKLDISMFTAEYDRSAQLTDRFKALLDAEPDDTKRITILEIKEAMREGKKYRKGVDGKLIYQAVLNDGVASISAFERLLSSKPL